MSMGLSLHLFEVRELPESRIVWGHINTLTLGRNTWPTIPSAGGGTSGIYATAAAGATVALYEYLYCPPGLVARHADLAPRIFGAEDNSPAAHSESVAADIPTDRKVMHNAWVTCRERPPMEGSGHFAQEPLVWLTPMQIYTALTSWRDHSSAGWREISSRKEVVDQYEAFRHYFACIQHIREQRIMPLFSS